MEQRIGIMGAMAQEIDNVKELVENRKSVIIGNREFIVGTLNGVECVVVFSKWGKVAAGITATILAQEFKVTDLIFSGTAGAIADGLKVGDVVVSRRLVQHDLDSRPLFDHFEIPLLNKKFLDADERLSSIASKAITTLFDNGAENMIGKQACNDFGINKPTLYIGDIASGDQFINSDEKRNNILGPLPDVKCVEMEGAAVAQVCHEFGLPFTVIRTISDTADHNARIDFGKFIVEVANNYSKAIITEIMKNIKR